MASFELGVPLGTNQLQPSLCLWTTGEARRSSPLCEGSPESKRRQCGGGGGSCRAFTLLGPAGRVAAQNMLAQEAEICTVPYLWTAMFGKSLRYAGNRSLGTGRGQEPLGAGLG